MRESKATQGSPASMSRDSAARTARRAPRQRARVIAAVAALLCAGTVLWMPSQAWAESDAVKALAAPPPISLPLKPSPEFAKFPRYAGTLGKRPIVLRLGPKTDDPSGVHGEYQYGDTGEVILIAGDRADDTLEVEESNDGTHITGNWVGKFGADGALEGERMNVDDSDPQPFDLKPLAAGQAVPVAGAGVANAAAPKPATVPQPAANGAPAPAAGGHAVGGVSNLQTGD